MGLLQQVLGDGSGGGEIGHLTLEPQGGGVCRVLTESNLHVGNLKQIGGLWKFKAVGYDASGQVIPGGGPLTDKHNTVFAKLDVADVNLVLG